MSKTATEIETKVDTITAFIEAGDYASAVPHADSLMFWLATKPDTDFSKSGLSYDRETLLELCKRVQAKADREAISAETVTQIPVRRQTSACSTGTCGCSSS